MWIRENWPAVLGAAAGAGLGVTYALTIGCATGGCPITSSPWLSGGFGALLGYTIIRDFVMSRRPEASQTPEPDEVTVEGGTQ